MVDTNGEGIDAIFFDEDNREFWFVQGKGITQFNHSRYQFPENDIKITIAGLEFLLTGDYKGKITPLIETYVDEFHQAEREASCKKNLVFLTLKTEPPSSNTISRFKQDHRNIEVSFFDFKKLKSYYEKDFLPSLASAPDQVRLHVGGLPISERKKGIDSVVLSCSGKDLAEIYEDNKIRIFQKNVRYYLGHKPRSINEKMKNTAEGNESTLFWYYNNGITFVVSDYSIPERGDTLLLNDPQIINGAQTTYALYESYKKGSLKEDVEVLVRVIKSKDKNFTEKITLYSNSQNPIRLRDLQSNDTIQVVIQNALKSTYQYFYERKRGEFDASYPAEPSRKREFGENYKAKIISNENAAESFLAIYLNRPSNSKKEKSRFYITDNGGFYDRIFDENDPILPEKLLFSWLLLRFIINKKKEYINGAKKAKGEEAADLQKLDFIPHSEFFIASLFKDFLSNAGKDISKKEDLISLKESILRQEQIIESAYSKIVEKLQEFIELQKKDVGYYHNKFFKNDTSIVLTRAFFKASYPFVQTN